MFEQKCFGVDERGWPSVSSTSACCSKFAGLPNESLAQSANFISWPHLYARFRQASTKKGGGHERTPRPVGSHQRIVLSSLAIVVLLDSAGFLADEGVSGPNPFGYFCTGEPNFLNSPDAMCGGTWCADISRLASDFKRFLLFITPPQVFEAVPTTSEGSPPTRAAQGIRPQS